MPAQLTHLLSHGSTFRIMSYYLPAVHGCTDTTSQCHRCFSHPGAEDDMNFPLFHFPLLFLCLPLRWRTDCLS